ncbi:MAG TPA: ATP-binding protein [Actinomycetota bacterium]|nr:ATP-binding protein [Actinomycetota bacterium]
MERSFRIPATPDASRVARQALDGWLNDLVGRDRADDVRLLTTELVSNAIRHGGVPQGSDITVDVAAFESSVTVFVRQPTSVERVALRTGGAPEEGGLGLQLVDRLADGWGVEHGIPGSVWFGVLGSESS